MIDKIGTCSADTMKQSVFTFEENIAFMEQAATMARDQENTCREWDIKEEDFYMWMFGWMLGTLESCAKDMRLIAAK